MITIFWSVVNFLQTYNGAVTAVATVFIGVFTLVLSCITRRQAKLTKNSIDLARDEFRASHRPEIIVHSIEFRRIPGTEATGDLFGASILCFNKGRTAALKIDVHADILVTHNLEIDIQRPILKTLSELPSGIKLQFEVNSQRPVRELVTLLKVATPYCVGTISYFDQNETRRETGFCFVIREIGSHGTYWVSAKSPEHEYAY